MKFLKKLFYTIATLIMLSCIVVLICALNPSLTQSLAAVVNGQETDSSGAVGEELPDAIIPDTTTPSQQVQVGYIPPSEDSLTLPTQVYGKSGYEPVKGEEEQLPDAEAEELQAEGKPGESGDNLSFDTEMYPHYGMLDDELQQLYRQIYANAVALNDSFAPTITVGVNRVRDVFEAVYNDHPELFWLETGYSCKYTRQGICLEITLKYNETVNRLSEAKAQFEQQAQSIVSEASKLATAYEREVYVHDALVAKVEYDTAAAMSQSAYSALVNGRSVCAGYARAFQYVMQQLGIPCYYCTGYSGENHAWNIVKLDGSYYNVDVTWDDTQPATYDYLNKTDLDYAKTHVRKSLSVYLPACNGAVGGDSSTGNVNNTESDDNLGTTEATETTEPAESTENQYINPDPQKPLTYEDGMFDTPQEREEREYQKNLDKAGITEEEVLDDMKEYYADCLEQMVEVGTGQKYFTNVVPVSIWPGIEQAYSHGSYEEGYVKEALKKMEVENFAIQLQVEDLSGGYYRIYHNISTW